MHQFVSEHVVGLVIGQRERVHHAIFEGFGHAARTRRNASLNGVGLLKVCVVVVQQHEVAARDGIVEHLAVAVVPVFGQFGNPAQSVGCLLAGDGIEVVVNFEVGRLVAAPVEALVARLVLTEVLGFRQNRYE